MTILGASALTATTTAATRVSAWTALALTEGGGMGAVADATITTTGASYIVRVAGNVLIPAGEFSGMRLFLTIGGTKQSTPIAAVEVPGPILGTGRMPIAGAQVITAASGEKTIGLVAEYIGAAKLLAPTSLIIEEVG